jgi:nucleoside-diphosphate-sugar epimerase
VNVVITGGAGYVGTKLAEQYLLRNHHVTIVDNFMFGANSILHLMKYKHLTVVRRDIRSNDYSYLNGCDILFHLAGLSGMPMCKDNPVAAKAINVEATRNLVANCSSAQSIIYASTTSIYGRSSEDCTELSQVNPISLYSQTKYEAENIVMQHPNSISLRFATLFGVSTRMRINSLLVNGLSYEAVKNGYVVLYDSRAMRAFLHIDDAVNAYIFAGDNLDKMQGNIYNVNNPKLNCSKMGLANIISEFTDLSIYENNPKTIDLDRFDARDFNVSSAKIESLGYQSNISLHNGVEELMKLYRFYPGDEATTVI